MDVLFAAACAAVIGALGPLAIRRLPEPANPDPDDPKIPYLVIAAPRWLPWLLAVIAAAMAAVVAWGTDRNELLPAWVVICGVGSWLSYVDARTRYLPMRLTYPLLAATVALVGVGALVTSEWRTFAASVAGVVGVWLVFELIYQVGRFFGRGAFGYGDVRLAVVLGAVLAPLGWTEIIVGLYAGFLLSLIVGVPLRLLGVIGRANTSFGQYLVAGAVLGAVWPTLVL